MKSLNSRQAKAVRPDAPRLESSLRPDTVRDGHPISTRRRLIGRRISSSPANAAPSSEAGCTLRACYNATSKFGAALFAALLLSGPACTKSSPADHADAKPDAVSTAKRIRQPAVAGLFYPSEPAALRRAIDGYLKEAKDYKLSSVRAIIVPHAGYQYSGLTAAHAYKLVSGKPYKTVVVLAPSHYALFNGASVCGADEFETPLGRVPISPLAKELAKQKPFVAEAPCRVQRPAWARQSPRQAPPVGEDTPHTWEHSDEVQVPFLQQSLKGFAVVPIIFGRVDPAEAARVLADKLDDQTLLVASSDLSHYYPYERAREMDKKCVDAICRLDIESMAGQEACGKDPILCVMQIARQKGWTAQMLDYRNSGDTAGDKNGVVGYSAIAFTAPSETQYSKDERKALLALARKSLTEVVTHGRLPDAKASDFTPRCSEEKGCFVTLTKNGVLRGCIGNIMPNGPLWKSVMENARNAAIRDYRFPPVQPDELRQIEIEISVLTVPQPLKFDSPDDLVKKLRPHKDGVVLELGLRTATYLPQVWEQISDPVQFLSSLSMKAGAGPDDWRRPGTRVLVYQVEAFKESEL